jgi:hypothetical protein
MVCYYLPINWCISKLYPNCNVSAPTKQKSHFWQSGWQHRFFCILVGRFVSEDASPFFCSWESWPPSLFIQSILQTDDVVIEVREVNWVKICLWRITHDCMLRPYICLFTVHITHFQLHVSNLLQLKQPMELVEVMKTAIGYYFS